MRETVGTTEAAFRLGVSAQRVRQLLKDNRIKGARKINGIWIIPLTKGIPKVIERHKGPKGRWHRRLRQSSTKIHIKRQVLASNRKNKANNPPILIRQGNRTTACHFVEIPAPCRLVYQPERPLPCGAVLWIEVEANIPVQGASFSKGEEFRIFREKIAV